MKLRHRRWWVETDAAVLQTGKPEAGKHIEWDHGYLPHQAACLAAIRFTDGEGEFSFRVGEVSEPPWRVVVENVTTNADGANLCFESMEEVDPRSCVLHVLHDMPPGLYVCRVERFVAGPTVGWEAVERWQGETTGPEDLRVGEPPWDVSVKLQKLPLP